MDSATPLWVTLLVAALGITGTLVAALVSSAATARRERARTESEVEREVARSREAIQAETARSRDAREQEASRRRVDLEVQRRDRLVAERRAAYTEFMIGASRWARYVESKREQRSARSGGHVPFDAGAFADALDQAFAAVQLFARGAAVDTASKVHHNLLVTSAHLEATHFSAALVSEGCALVADNLKQFVAVARADVNPEGPVEAESRTAAPPAEAAAPTLTEPDERAAAPQEEAELADVEGP